MLYGYEDIKVGDKVVVLTTYLYRYTGKVVDIRPHALVITDVAWIPETGRYSDSFRTGEFKEVEPEPDRSVKVINLLHVGDVTKVTWPLPRSPK